MRFGSRSLALVLSLSAVLAAGSAAAANNAMKDLMKQMGSIAAGDDAKALVPLLDKAKAMKPADPDFAGWDASADKGKAAAASGDLAAAKAACKDCHTKYRDKFKAKFGSKAP